IVHLYSVCPHLAETRPDYLCRDHIGSVSVESDLTSTEESQHFTSQIPPFKRLKKNTIIRARSPGGVVNALELDLDPRDRYEHEGPYPAEDLKDIQLGFRPEQTTKIGTAMNLDEEDLLVTFLKANHDVFAWSAKDMPGVDLDFICHQLSIEQGARLVTQKKRKQGEEKREAAREETRKLLSAGFVREV
ncbi:hypothetical protein CR513_41081, partial [Mucuna pruriens]